MTLRAQVFVGLTLTGLLLILLWLLPERIASVDFSFLDEDREATSHPIKDGGTDSDSSRVRVPSESNPTFHHPRVSEQFEAVLMAGSGLDEFILEHLELAKAGNADSAYYVSEAMQYCAMELLLLETSYRHYNTQGDEVVPGLDTQGDQVAPSLDEVIEVIMDGLVGTSEFYRREARRRLDRAAACKNLNWQPQFLSDQGTAWATSALSLGQPIALARSAKLDPTNPPGEQQLERSKEIMRGALQQSRDLRTLLYASSVVAVNTQRNHLSERLAWGILACEYDDCEQPMNYLYRGVCEVTTLNQTFVCSADMSDLDYLFQKYPDEFDFAKARAEELHQALTTEDWSTVGLQ